MAIKSKELAKLLGVSTATMSLVLNNKPGISDELRNSLIEKITDMGYGYKLKELPTSIPTVIPIKKKNIAYAIFPHDAKLIPDYTAFFSPIIEGAEKAARELGYSMIITHIEKSHMDSLSNYINAADFAGVIIQTSAYDARIISQLESIGIPYILNNIYSPCAKVDTVTINNEQGIFDAVNYLKQMGHTKIGYIHRDLKHNSLYERFYSYHRSLDYYNLEHNPQFEISVPKDTVLSEDAIIQYLKKKPPLPTAFLIENDHLAWYICRAFKKCGYKIPEDISFIGFNGFDLCNMMDPPLTTLKVPHELFGIMLFKLLEAKIQLAEYNMESVPMKLEINVDLIPGGSVAKIDVL